MKVLNHASKKVYMFLKNATQQKNYEGKTSKEKKSMAHDDLQEYLVRFGLAVRGVWWMMEDRGYALQEWQRQLLEKTPLEIAHAGLEAALEKQCSLGQAFSSTFRVCATAPAAAAAAQGQAKTLRVVFFDRNFDDTKGKEVMISSNLLRKSIEELDAPSDADVDAKAKATAVKETELSAIFVLPNKLSPDAKKLASKYAARIQTLTFERMFIPVGRHVQVPRHVRLTSSEASAFEEARRIQRHQLLVLRLDDPVSQYYGFEVGDIVRIERPGGAAYRVVDE
jgi:DNA-directed RNA polymerase subunit H (RpoH/RPB5)